jgi:hypothetical protein
MPRVDEVEVAVVGREPLDAATSFCGGTGGASGAVGGVGAPNGPSGSSTASRRGAWTPCCRFRGPRPAGERGAADALDAEDVFCLGDEVGSGDRQSRTRLLNGS